MSIPINRDFGDLDNERLVRLQNAFRDYKLLIIDKKSMIRLRFLSWIDRRLRQIRATYETLFSSINLLFCGNFSQLAPVIDTPLYQPLYTASGDDHRLGKLAYNSIETTKTLVQIMRQQGDSPDNLQFRQLLDELREGPISLQSWHFFVSRTKGILPNSKWHSFNDAIRIYATKVRMSDFNLDRLERLKKPVLWIEAKNSYSKAKEAPGNVAGNLDNTLILYKDAKVILSWNLYTEEGLVNGSIGTVYSILWDNSVTDPKTMPAIIMVDFSYSGPASIDVEGTYIVPILPKTT